MNSTVKHTPPNADTPAIIIAIMCIIASLIILFSSCTAIRDFDDLNPEAGVGEVLWLNCEQVENHYTEPENQGLLINIQFSVTKPSGFAQVKFYFHEDGIWKTIVRDEDGEPYTDEFTNLRRLQSQEHVMVTYNFLTPIEGRYKVEVIVDGSSTKTCEAAVK